MAAVRVGDVEAAEARLLKSGPGADEEVCLARLIKAFPAYKGLPGL